MRNNTLSKIAVKTASRPRSHFNLAHDVNTTASFGDLQPLQCRFIVPNGKMTSNIKTLIRLAPMLRPTFGRLKAKTWHSFVDIDDICPQYAAMMAQEPSNFGGNTYTPTKLPHIMLGYLSSLVLIGSKCTAYKVPTGANLNGTSFQAYTAQYASLDGSDLPTEGNAIWTDVADNAVGAIYPTPVTLPFFDNYNGWCIRLNKLFTSWSINGTSQSPFPNNIVIPVCNQNKQSFFEFTGVNEPSAPNTTGLMDLSSVSLDGADYVVPFTANNHQYLLAFRLSAYGKRLRKVLIGCGYQINFDSSTDVSLLPLFAWYKAYFDSFGLCLYNNYESTNLFELINKIAANNVHDMKPVFQQTQSNICFAPFWGFINDLANCWVTDGQDFVSLHTAKTGIAPSNPTPNFFDVDVNTGFTPNVANPSPYDENGHAYINDVLHGQLDSEYLKILYRNTNRSTLAGRRIAELLRMQGLGDYANECKSNFIGYNETIITISDVVNNSDTFNAASGQGMLLGDYAGRGLEYNESKTFTFETEKGGYWVTLFAVVPESGYCQGIDPNILSVDKMSCYNPDYDGLGMAADKKLTILGNRDVYIGESGAQDATFGFAPQYTALKIAQNKANGDFSLRGTRSEYTPFTLDKLIFAGDFITSNTSQSVPTGCVGRQVNRTFKYADVPTAGDAWRYVSRYPWLNNFMRIFAQVGELEKLTYNLFGDFFNNASVFWLSYNEYDNFMVHNIVNSQAYLPMLPIERSFETSEEGNEGGANSTINKA